MKIAESAETVIFATNVMKIIIWVSKDIVIIKGCNKIAKKVSFSVNKSNSASNVPMAAKYVLNNLPV